MAVTREQFESGMTYAAYKAQMTRNLEQVEQNEKDLQLTAEDVQAFRDLPRTVNVMALAEDWCGDVVANLPILGKLEQASNGKLNVRIHLRDQQPGSQIMDQYLNKGQFKSIPTFVFLDGQFNELGVWVERPDSVTRLREEKRLELYAQHPEWGDPSKPIAELPEDVRARVQQATGAMRNETRPFANAEVVRELRELVQRASTRQPV
ncbi:MAG TPA: thioredoxin family protein [Chloroflexota bacterium]